MVCSSWLKRSGLIGALVLGVTTGVLNAQAPPGVLTPAMPDVQRLGPQVGTTVPSFSLPDQQGTVRTLPSLMGPKGLLLVFYRSADWCPYCKTHLAELQSRTAQLTREGLGIAAISYDPVATLADFTRRRGITFPLLSDAGSSTIRAYGLFNTTIPESNTQSYGIPFPGTFVLNRDGVVTARFFEQAYQERATVGSMLARLGNGQAVQATTIDSPQVQIATYTTDSTVAAGTHFSVVLDVTPAADVHVYAPGVTGYKPIALTMAPQAGLLVRDTIYPPSEPYHFKPLNETVPAYQRPFRIVQDLAIDPTPQGTAALKGQTAIRITATLTYQACNATVCFTPQSVPLTWTVSLAQLDRERAQPSPR